MSKPAPPIVLVTGASRGLGRATALSFARLGASLLLCARGQAELDAVAAAARALGGTVVTLAADLRLPRDIERLAALAFDRFGAVDVLVNNASELGPTPLPQLADYPADAFADVLRVNVEAPFRLTQAIVGRMLARERGTIINISSDVAVNGYSGWGAYAVSKAAIDSLTRTWGTELEGTGVRIYSVDPGDMDTAMHRAALPGDDPAALLRPEAVAPALVRLATGDVAPSGTRVLASMLLDGAGA
jgi:NAD(P)-dependent dehydrogenase (short-subunit alcohol dehydrogenase family)